jgi:type II secretory pathway component PulJ
MTPERKKTLWLMVAILCSGILIGALAVALVNKTRHYRASWRKEGKEAFIQRIMGVIDADSVQAKQIRPHILDAISSIDSLQKKTDDQVHTVLAAFEKNIEPLVTEEQMEQLRRFHSKARDPKD